MVCGEGTGSSAYTVPNQRNYRPQGLTAVYRRVRLGLVLSEIGEKNNLQVSRDELRRALVEQARRYPGREKQVYEYYEKTPGALAELRAPIFEDKVIDHVIEVAKPTEKKVSRDELLKAVEEATER